MLHDQVVRESTDAVRTSELERFGIHGRVSPGFEAVQKAFIENFVRRGELSGACCAFFARRQGRRPVGWHSQ